MNINCQEHRKTMELLGLKMRLKEGNIAPEEKKKILEEIERLEKELNLD